MFFKKYIFEEKKVNGTPQKMSILCNPSVCGNSSFFVEVENIVILMKLQ